MDGSQKIVDPNDIQRAPLGDYTVAGGHTVDRVRVQHVTLAPGAAMAPHKHPGPFVVYVLKGGVVSQVAGREAATVTPGAAMFEPGHTRIERFANASDSEPAELVMVLMF